ncbi:porin family protein [Alcanivorax sp. JB21]|uniref:porin family protein n=1 Tax=Alcanivorax limicola TaxID=2874102 RepID=UPI001CBFB526|nr:porin family protein [Alcanivorax limicola]MBZ2189138.1 porin family protein [Alcanivorax limicola]
MKKWIAAIGATSVMTFAGVAQAQQQFGMQPEFYFGAQYNYVEAKVSGISNPDFDVLSGRLGAQLNPYISGEARLGFGIGGDRIGGTKVEIDNYYGFYARASLPNQTAFTPYLLGGWTDARTKTGGTSESADGGSYGVGADFNLDPFLALNLEYARLLDKDVDLDAISLGFTFKF